jgi:sugar O-acyltransferase (sialic acid O-acetyltransferase NeuD family)
MKSAGVVIIGGAAGSKIAWDVYIACARHVVGFMDNFVPEEDWPVGAPPRLGSTDQRNNIDLLRQPDIEYFVATGDNAMRRDATERLVGITGKRPANAVHPSAVVSTLCRIGDGNLICARAVVNPFADVGTGTIVNTAAVVEHDCVIGDYAQISPGAVLAGYVRIGAGAFVGSNATVIPKKSVGAGATVAAGAVVIEDVGCGELVAGVPAVLKQSRR